MEGKTKTARIDQKSTFLFLCSFFLKIQDIRKPKTPLKFFGSRVDHFLNKPFLPFSIISHLQSESHI